MILSKTRMREISQLKGHVEDNQKLWRGQLVRHHIRSPNLMLFCSFLPWLIDNLGCCTLFSNHIEILKTLFQNILKFVYTKTWLFIG